MDKIHSNPCPFSYVPGRPLSTVPSIHSITSHGTPSPSSCLSIMDGSRNESLRVQPLFLKEEILGVLTRVLGSKIKNTLLTGEYDFW